MRQLPHVSCVPVAIGVYLSFVTTNTPAAWAALGDPSRRAIVERLAERPRTVAELTRELPLSQPAISQHLKVLRAADIVTYTADGARHVYEVRPDGLAALRDDLDRYWRTALQNFQRIAEEER
jgi:DNA-binding transcriptional ArsR family regulator